MAEEEGQGKFKDPAMINLDQGITLQLLEMFLHFPLFP